ncbi:receptor-like serine/threonine-protein kinase SD1-8 isoform X1 [Canna indica]|uniref:non-specific serine/threonine protein kinase n=1 Tax=Canna indica TaxID=4628 RepID=A0AAQ3K110_9LILI|nr:receptor-like serine/threonine-protein kinase SD1-8 isoform X1 [Canna indica]
MMRHFQLAYDLMLLGDSGTPPNSHDFVIVVVSIIIDTILSMMNAAVTFFFLKGYPEKAAVMMYVRKAFRESMIEVVDRSPVGLFRRQPLIIELQIMISRASFLTVYLLITTDLFSLSLGADSLLPHQPLVDDGKTLISAGGSFELGFFSPVGAPDKRYVGIWYHKVSQQTVIWVANRQRPVIGGPGSLLLATDGKLVIADENSTTVWSSSSPPVANPVAQLLDDGNLVVKQSGSNSADPKSMVWQSFDFPTDTLLPGMKLGWNMTSGLDRKPTSWTSPSDPSVGNYTLEMDTHGDPQAFLYSKTGYEWRAGPWNGIQYSGIPDMQTYPEFSFSFVTNREEVFYSFFVHDPAIITRLTVLPSGQLQRLVWIEHNKVWTVFWFAPKDQCDAVSTCGPNGICDSNKSPICECMEGFLPRNPTNWGLRDWSDGCDRKTALDCQNRTDGFMKLSNSKLPDTSKSIVDLSLNLEQCREACLRNCSCTAYTNANISGDGSGCIMWMNDLSDIRMYASGGQELNFRLAAKDIVLSDGKHSRRRVYLITAVVVLVFVILIAAAGVAFCVWKRKKRRRTMSGTISLSLHSMDEGTDGKELDLPVYELAAIVAATDNFSAKNKLGEGGFGPVYKGKFGDQEQELVAVKRLSKTSMQGLDEFKNEVTVIAKLQHRNLVRLVGCSIQGEERILIYEFMPNGSLDAILFDKVKCEMLDWRRRYNIIVGIARGLLYLHEDSRLRIIHRDLKASNILLDNNMNPKISDFGMARIFGGDETEVNTMKVVGTYGYMSPEYAMDGIFSVKSDVFSFGVLVLEIVSGKKNRGVYYAGRNLNLLAYTWSLWNEEKVLELADESILGNSFPVDEVMRCIKVGLLCVQEMPEDRPTMSSVVLMLGSESSSLPQPNQPGFVASRGPVLEIDTSISKQDTLSINNVSVTMFEGR